MLVALALIIRSGAPPILDRMIELQKVRNEGKKHDQEAQVIATEGVSKTVEIAISGMREVMIEQRKFNAERIDNMLSGMKLLEDRIRDLEEQIDDKDKRIVELELENERLHHEVNTLRLRVDKKEVRKPAPKKRAA